MLSGLRAAGLPALSPAHTQAAPGSATAAGPAADNSGSAGPPRAPTVARRKEQRSLHPPPVLSRTILGNVSFPRKNKKKNINKRLWGTGTVTQLRCHVTR